MPWFRPNLWSRTSRAAAVLFAVAALAGTAQGAERPIFFDVWREGSLIGSHRIDFTRQGDDLRVDIAIELKVDFAYITVYRYEHRNRELWRGDRLLAMQSSTDDDGDRARVLLQARDGELAVEGTKFTGTMPGDLLPTTYWREDSVRAARLVSSQDGRIFEVTVTPLGEEDVLSEGRMVKARHYSMRGDLDLDLWYDADGQWVRLTFKASDGSLIEYRRVTPPAVLAGGEGK
jgi:hypothetical protein